MKRVGVTLAVVTMAAATLAASGVFAAPAPAPASTKAAVTVNVTMLDFKFKLSKTSVPKGSVVTFKTVNKGNTAHDFDFSTVKGGTPYLAKGKTAQFKVTFKKAGQYRFVCTVPRHAQLGMAGYFKVK
jgi:plastocyanin